MQCTYKIIAHNQPRVLARIIQLFDQQLLTLHSLVFKRLANEVHLTVTIECEPARTDRLAAKLHSQLAIHSVELLLDACTRDKQQIVVNAE
jgi:hypothetical protein